MVVTIRRFKLQHEKCVHNIGYVNIVSTQNQSEALAGRRDKLAEPLRVSSGKHLR